MARAKFFKPVEILKQATSENTELFKLSGLRHPYQEGPLGVIQEGAYADILIVDGNPLEDISVIGGNPKWYDAEPRGPGIPTIRIIMKDGRIYKNALTDWHPEYLRRPDPDKLRTSETY